MMSQLPAAGACVRSQTICVDEADKIEPQTELARPTEMFVVGSPVPVIVRRLPERYWAVMTAVGAV